MSTRATPAPSRPQTQSGTRATTASEPVAKQSTPTSSFSAAVTPAPSTTTLAATVPSIHTPSGLVTSVTTAAESTAGNMAEALFTNGEAVDYLTQHVFPVLMPGIESLLGSLKRVDGRYEGPKEEGSIDPIAWLAHYLAQRGSGAAAIGTVAQDQSESQHAPQ